ncbi:MAG: PAS domain-containing protein [Pseudomonadota bacterium]
MATDQSPDTRQSGAPYFAVQSIAEDLARNDLTSVRSYFAAHGIPDPRTVWSPKVDAMGSPVLRSFAEVCDVLGQPEGPIPQTSFRLDAFDGLERWMMVLTRDGDHFRYAHYGAEIRDHYGHDMTGKTTADFGGYISVFFDALYLAATRRGARVLSEHEPPQRVFVRAWRRLIVPLVDCQGAVTGFVGANVPDNELRAGLEMITDPVIVTDRGAQVLYANAAALQFFHAGPGPLPHLRSMAGLDLGGLKPPEVLLARREVVERLELTQDKTGLMETVALSISAAEHRGHAYYVLHVRPLDRG